MTIHTLPQARWHELLELGDPQLTELPNTDRAVIVVAEEDGEIIGYWMITQVVHIEPAWVRPDKRGGLVVSRLWNWIREFLDSCRIPQAFCLTDQPTVRNYLTRLGLEQISEAAFLYEKHELQKRT